MTVVMRAMREIFSTFSAIVNERIVQNPNRFDEAERSLLDPPLNDHESGSHETSTLRAPGSTFLPSVGFCLGR
jgi:hypothetical protein